MGKIYLDLSFILLKNTLKVCVMFLLNMVKMMQAAVDRTFEVPLQLYDGGPGQSEVNHIHKPCSRKKGHKEHQQPMP